MYFKRIFLIVLDSVGIGHASDAEKFGDLGANTIGNISEKVGLNLPNLEKMGLGNIYPIKTIKAISSPRSFTSYMQAASVGKDSVAGHWELMGCILDKPFNIFCANGFPRDLIERFEQETGKRILGNKEANGIKIIHEYGQEHLQTGGLIVYTSVDSTFQIAAHEEVVPLEDLYQYCKIARQLTLENPQWMISRVIARPFIGQIGNFTRTENRKDYALNPFSPIVLSALKEAEYDVIGLGKIGDLYNQTGLTQNIKTKNNADGIKQLHTVLEKNFKGLAFLNLVDFDSVYGHPRDPIGYRNALQEFDFELPEIIDKLTHEDLLILTADHGNDPTYKGNDHTRENVPLIVYSKKYLPCSLNPRDSFADVGATIAENFKIKWRVGTSFLNELIANKTL